MMRTLIFSIILSLGSVLAQADTRLPEQEFNILKEAGAIRSGDILYVDFWASWCNPCRKSFPWMNSMADKYKDQGFKILAINVDKERALADRFLGMTETHFPVFYDPEGHFAELFKLKGMPSSFILSADGSILSTHKGFFDHQLDNYEQEIQTLLKASR